MLQEDINIILARNYNNYFIPVLSELQIIGLFKERIAQVGRDRWKYLWSGQGVTEKTVDNIYKYIKVDKDILRGIKPITIYLPIDKNDLLSYKSIQDQETEMSFKNGHLETIIRDMTKSIKNNKAEEEFLSKVNPELIQFVKACIRIYHNKHDTDADLQINTLLTQLDETTVDMYQKANTQKVAKLKKTLIQHIEIINAIQTLANYK